MVRGIVQDDAEILQEEAVAQGRLDADVGGDAGEDQRTDAAGAQQAVVVGDPSKPGFYMVYNKWTKGNHFSRPHFHPNDRFIVVLQGTWWVGSGPNFDPANGTVPMPAGSFVTHYAKQVHWDGAKDEDAILLIMGEGPATTTLAEQK